jgi:RND family efflux transporter MFP subunit
MRRFAYVVVALVVATFVGLVATTRLNLRSARATAARAQLPVRPAPRPTAEQEKAFVGVLLPPLMANLASRADGRLIKVNVRVGETVRKGDVLATFDQRERQQDLQIAEAQLKAAAGAAAAAGAELGAARARAARRNATVDIGGGRRVQLVSGEEASQSVAEARGAAGRAASAAGSMAEQKARIGALRLSLEEATLKAPFDGVVTAVNFEGGMNVHANETVVRVVGGGNALRLRLAVPEEDGARVRNTPVARFRLEDGRTLTAQLNHISPEVDTATRSIFAEGDIDLVADERQIALLSGRTVRAVLGAK